MTLGFFCDTKAYVRKNNDQDYSKLNNLLIESFEQYKSKKLGIKLWYRFWRTIEMYQMNASYEEVLQTLFGAKSTATITSHKKNINFNSLLNKIV